MYPDDLMKDDSLLGIWSFWLNLNLSFTFLTPRNFISHHFFYLELFESP